jgi:hypothetical protein
MPEYRVKFGAAIGTVLYEDACGELKFSFDMGTSGGKNLISLFPIRKTTVQSEQAWIDSAFEKVKEYVRSCGYQVRVVEKKAW